MRILIFCIFSSNACPSHKFTVTQYTHAFINNFKLDIICSKIPYIFSGKISNSNNKKTTSSYKHSQFKNYREKNQTHQIQRNQEITQKFQKSMPKQIKSNFVKMAKMATSLWQNRKWQKKLNKYQKSGLFRIKKNGRRRMVMN